MDVENSTKEILDVLHQEDIDAVVPDCMRRLGLNVVDGRLIVSQNGLAMLMKPEHLAWIYVRLGAFFHFQGSAELAYYLQREASKLLKNMPTLWEIYGYSLFLMHYLFMDKEEYFQQHKAYNRLFKDVWRFSHAKELHLRHKKIRIGYLSGDFRRHVALLFSWVMVAKYDRERFEVYCFSTGEEDGFSQEIKKRVDSWVNIRDMVAPQAAKEICKYEIDILFELGGHSSHNLPILAYKPAPVQICGIGYFATTGLQTVDYFLTDRYLMQDGGARYFVEEPLVMSNTHFCFSPLNDMPKEVKGAPCKKNGYVTFGSLSDPLKINDVVLVAWGEILATVPDSRLLLKGRTFEKQSGIDNMLDRLKKVGINAERVELQEYSMPYLPVYWDIDIALDTFPYPGGGTTCDALCMGVPVITLGDGSHGGNFGISILQNAGLGECCTYTREDYVKRAVALASDWELLDMLHLGIRNMFDKSPLRDEIAYMQELEGKYEYIWHKYLRG